MANVGDGTRDLDAWLAPFLDVLGRKTRRTWAPLYLRGLLRPRQRPRLPPPAAPLAPSAPAGARPAPAGARACSPWRRGGAYRGTTSGTTSSPARPGTTPRFGRR